MWPSWFQSVPASATTTVWATPCSSTDKVTGVGALFTVMPPVIVNSAPLSRIEA